MPRKKVQHRFKEIKLLFPTLVTLSRIVSHGNTYLQNYPYFKLNFKLDTLLPLNQTETILVRKKECLLDRQMTVFVGVDLLTMWHLYVKLKTDMEQYYTHLPPLWEKMSEIYSILKSYPISRILPLPGNLIVKISAIILLR